MTAQGWIWLLLAAWIITAIGFTTFIVWKLEREKKKAWNRAMDVAVRNAFDPNRPPYAH